MDREMILEKFEALRRCIRRVESKRPETAEFLVSDWDLQDVTTLNLSRTVQLYIDIVAHIIAWSKPAPPDSRSVAFDQPADLGILSRDLAGKIKKAVGFQNMAVHNDEAID
jgi:uncharacterized protein YutE (UPF0331/DUF86 family)